jgi:hypothetical protein
MTMTVIIFITPKAAAKNELLFKKLVYGLLIANEAVNTLDP